MATTTTDISKNDTVLGITSNGEEITVTNCREFLTNENKDSLANFIYERLYGRYLKSFDFPDSEYTKNYKNGFTIMASCCLLIETYISFKYSKYNNTDGASGECFGMFFTTESLFQDLSQDAFGTSGKLRSRKEGGLPNDFYSNVRCGILHNAETKNGWKITRNTNKPYFNIKTKEINATKFANRMKTVLNQYRKDLQNADFKSDPLWNSFRDRLELLIQNV